MHQIQIQCGPCGCRLDFVDIKSLAYKPDCNIRYLYYNIFQIIVWYLVAIPYFNCLALWLTIFIIWAAAVDSIRAQNEEIEGDAEKAMLLPRSSLKHSTMT